MSPEDKSRLILQQRALNNTVVFVGDGVNDSPALSVADVGIAVGSAVEFSLRVSNI